MNATPRICIVDRNDKRRARLADMLGRSYSVAAIREPGDLLSGWPEAAVAFVADEYGNVPHVRHIAVQQEEVLPIVAYAEGVDSNQAIAAVYAGAIDCIDLNRHRRDLPQRFELALRRRDPEFAARLRAMRSTGELAGLSRLRRRILGLFAAGKGHAKVSCELAMSEAQLAGEIDAITKQLQRPSLNEAVRMMIDYFR